MTISELVTYNGKDREAVLYAGAKTEGKVTWYTSLAGDSYKGMIKAFETKYAGVKIEAYRTNGGEITNRMVEEAKAKQANRRYHRNHRSQSDVPARSVFAAPLSLAVFRQLS